MYISIVYVCLFKKKHEGDNDAMFKRKIIGLSSLMCLYIHLMNVLVLLRKKYLGYLVEG